MGAKQYSTLVVPNAHPAKDDGDPFDDLDRDKRLLGKLNYLT